MAGHDLLPGCTTPWRHDCPGQEPGPDAGAEFVTGGMVCHCPCHGLERRIAALEIRSPDEATLAAALPDWLDRIAPSIRPFIAHLVSEAWPDAPLR